MFLFWCFVVVALLFACHAVMRIEPVYSILSLMVVFFCVALIFLLIGAEFVAMTLLMLYLGAVLVLFLFVVIMIDRLSMYFVVTKSLKLQWLGAGSVGFVLFLLFRGLANVTMPVLVARESALIREREKVSVQEIALFLFREDFRIALIGVAFILLVAVVGAVLLTDASRPSTRKHQSLREQIRRSSQIELKKVPFHQGVDVT